jgi:hypothetical protein
MSRAVRTATTPLEDGWLEYRADAMPTYASPAVRRAAKLAYYSGASHTLALLAESGNSPALLEVLVAELDAFIEDNGGVAP